MHPGPEVVPVRIVYCYHPITLVNLFFDITLTPLLCLVTLVNFFLHHPHPLNAGFVFTPCDSK